MRHDFKPTPSALSFAMWQLLGRLALPLRPTSGLNWRDYIESGGPATFIGADRG